MPKVPLSHGEWAEMRDIDDLRRSDTRAVLKAADDAGVSISADMDGVSLLGLATVQEALICRFIVSWSYQSEITPDAVTDLREKDLKTLGEYVAPALANVFGAEPPDPTSAAPSSPSASSG